MCFERNTNLRIEKNDERNYDVENMKSLSFSQLSTNICINMCVVKAVRAERVCFYFSLVLFYRFHIDTFKAIRIQAVCEENQNNVHTFKRQPTKRGREQIFVVFTIHSLFRCHSNDRIFRCAAKKKREKAV